MGKETPAVKEEVLIPEDTEALERVTFEEANPKL
jgi:hypothetical protein